MEAFEDLRAVRSSAAMNPASANNGTIRSYPLSSEKITATVPPGSSACRQPFANARIVSKSRPPKNACWSGGARLAPEERQVEADDVEAASRERREEIGREGLHLDAVAPCVLARQGHRARVDVARSDARAAHRREDADRAGPGAHVEEPLARDGQGGSVSGERRGSTGSRPGERPADRSAKCARAPGHRLAELP